MSEIRKYAEGKTYETVADCRKVNWEPWEEHYLKNHYYTTGPVAIAKYLDRTEEAVNSKARQFGLYRRINHGPEKTILERPPAIYSNRNTRQELLDKYAPLDKNGNVCAVTI